MPMNWTDLTDNALLLSIAMAMHRSAQQFRPIADWADLDPEIQQATMEAVMTGLATAEGIEFARRLTAVAEDGAVEDDATKALASKIDNLDHIIGSVIYGLKHSTIPEEFSHMARSLRDLEEAKAIAAGNRGV